MDVTKINSTLYSIHFEMEGKNAEDVWSCKVLAGSVQEAISKAMAAFPESGAVTMANVDRDFMDKGPKQEWFVW